MAKVKSASKIKIDSFDDLFGSSSMENSNQAEQVVEVVRKDADVAVQKVLEPYRQYYRTEQELQNSMDRWNVVLDEVCESMKRSLQESIESILR